MPRDRPFAASGSENYQFPKACELGCSSLLIPPRVASSIRHTPGLEDSKDPP
jgi:hypothetical protein